MTHNSRHFVPIEADGEEPRALHNAWRKFYDPDVPPPPLAEPLHPIFAPSLAPPPPGHNWWGAPIPGHLQPPPIGDESRRFLHFPGPLLARGGGLLPPPRGYDPLLPDHPPAPEFLERPVWAAPRAEDWRESPVTQFNERPPGSDRWSPGTVSSSARDRDGDWDRDQQGLRDWNAGPRRAVSPSYLHPERPLLEPSQAWKERERQLSFDQGPAPVPSGSSVSDFQARRFRLPPLSAPLPLPPPPPPLGRGRYNDRFAPPTFPRRNAPRRRQQRISARISARPKREPSPSSSESSARSRSRVSLVPPARPRLRGPGEPAEDLVFVEPLRRPPPALPAPVPVAGPSSLPYGSPISPHARFPFPSEPPRRKLSVSPSWSTQSSIRSSVHSSPRPAATELDPITSPKASPVAGDMVLPPPTGTNTPPQDDSEFILPGMRFLKDATLEPDLVPPLEGDNGDTGPVCEEAQRPEYSNAAAIKADDTLPHTGSAEVSALAKEPEHGTPAELDKSSVPSPPSILPPSGDHNLASPQSSPLSRKQATESVSEEHDLVQVAQKQDVIVEISPQDFFPGETSNAIEPALVAPESSPLSDPVPLSPPPDASEMLEVDESSSMDLEECSSSSSSSSSSPADDFVAALRVFIRARDGNDLQTRSERYTPILCANHALLDAPSTRISTLNDELVQDVLGNTMSARLEAHAAVSQALIVRFKKQEQELVERTRRLRAEYKLYHDGWVANCRKLDQSMASSASQGVEGLPMPSGRVTRRSAVFGDTVRSDLEMEQIIASLGNEDMTDPNVLAIRNTATIPDLVSTAHSAINVSFDDDNGLIDNPGEFFDVFDALGRWTDDEKQTYVQKYGIYPKQFGAIASFLPNKTQTQCIMFYYLHKKELIDFRAAISKYGPKRRRKGGRKTGKGKGNALLADIVKPSRPGADDDSGSHKHSGRFVKDSYGLYSGHFPTRRSPAMHINNKVSVRPSSTDVTRGSQTSTRKQEQKLSSDTDSTRSKRQGQDTPGAADATERPRKHQARFSRALPEAQERGEDKKNRQQEVTAGPSKKPSHRRVNSPNLISEDEGDLETVDADFDEPPKGAARPSRAIPSARERREREHSAHQVSVELGGKHKQADRSKDKQKRPPGRPPKKSKERASKVLEKTVSKSAISYVWSKGEEAFYLKLIARHGKDFEKIAGEMPAKTALQCRNYFRNHAKDLDLERIAEESNGSVALEEEWYEDLRVVFRKRL